MSEYITGQKLIPEELRPFLGQNIEKLGYSFTDNTLGKVRKFHQDFRRKDGFPVEFTPVDVLFLANRVVDMSLPEIGKAVGVGRETIRKIFKYAQLPYVKSEEAHKRDLRIGNGIYATDPETGLTYGEINRNRVAHLGGQVSSSLAKERGTGIFAVDPETAEKWNVINGRKQAREKLGMYGIDPETGERWVVIGSRNGASRGGRRSYELRKGIHALSSDQKKEAGKLSILSRKQKSD